MKTVIRAIAISSVLAVAASVSSVNADTSAPAEDMEMASQFMATAQAFVQSAVGANGNVLVNLDGEVASLFGFVENQSIKSMAEQAALKDSRVKTVRNHIVVSN